ncbi:unnamed protein product [Ectocarpus sp. CCAP 1310/34]|nr:unnamed protein product [Ectocarpus sp. CCAP 1310/34]
MKSMSPSPLPPRWLNNAKQTYYNEAEARDVCVPLLGAVEYVHSQGIVHRDLKPENLLLASANDATSIKLADFGFAASIRDGDLLNGCGTPYYVAPEMLKNVPYGTLADFGFAASIRDGDLLNGCGTPYYVAPEMLKNVPYGTSVDMWSIGVIIFVLLVGRLPFHDKDQLEMFRKIKRGAYAFNDEISDDAKDLIAKLLTVDPAKRLTASEACKHPWLTTDAPNLSCHNLSARLEDLKVFNTKRKLRAAVKTVVAMSIFAKYLEAVQCPSG